MWWLTEDHNRYNPTMRQEQSSKSLNLLRLSALIGFVLLTLSAALANPSDSESECGKLQHRCLCGVPRCIDASLVKNGVQDCQDASDEGQWDPSKCAIQNKTSEDSRHRRAVLAELMRVTNGGATTTFFEGERGRTRPVGLLTTTMGSFQISGTTTEYVTKLLATYIKGTYARILSTSSRIYHALPTDAPELSDALVRPTGFIASTVSTEIHGYATTVHTTDFYRTYIDNTYAQQISSYSNVYYPPWYTDRIVATAAAAASDEEYRDPGFIYATPVLRQSPEETIFQPVVQNGRFGKVIIAPVAPSRVASEIVPTALPQQLVGSLVPRNTNAKAELEIVQNSENQVQALRPNNNRDHEVKVTGTHGNFVHRDSGSGDETTYNVFTGTYVQNAKTFLFFFGNTVLQPTRPNELPPQQTLVVENGPQKHNVVVDMSRNLKLIVPGTKPRTTIEGSINGQQMEGVMVEVEGSEPGSYFGPDELISVDGATKETPSDPRIDQVTVTLDRNIKKTRTFSTSSSRSSKSSQSNEQENEIPTGRKINREGAAAEGTFVEAASFLRPTQARPVSLPTYTVGQIDGREGTSTNYYDATTDQSIPAVAYNVETRTSSSRQQSGRKPGPAYMAAPVFQRPTQESPKAYGRTQQGQPGSFRRPKTYSDFNEVESNSSSHDLNDLQSAASNRHATVTYVGFADFTTTVGNTVIVFMPRTKMIEDLSVHASKTRGPSVDPTRFAYVTTTEEEPETVVTTPRRPAVTEPEYVVFTTPEPPVEITTPEPPPVRAPSFSRTPKKEKKLPAPEIEPSETTILLSGTQTVFTNIDHHDSRILMQEHGAQTIVYDSDSSIVRSTPTFTSPLASPVPSASRASPRPRYTARPLASRVASAVSSASFTEVVPVSPSFLPVPVPESPVPLLSTSGHFATATTAIYQTEKANPTGLVTSIGGSIVRDSTTTLFTSLVLGTFIDGSYAQVIKSTSTVYFLIPSKSIEPTPIFSLIQPTPVARFTSVIPTKSAFSYEVTTTTEGSTEAEDIPETTTGQSYDRAEVSVTTSTTTESSRSTTKKSKDEEVQTTTGRVELDSSEGITSLPINPKKEELDEALNEIERARKVAGRPQDQVIVDNKGVIEKPTAAVLGENEEQTIYVTRTVPTTVYRTYTYFTTYFIPKDDETVSSVISREVTSTQVGLVKKTFSNVIPAVSASVTLPRVADPDSVDEEYDEDDVKPSSVRIVYKTFATTFTYLTTFFVGDTSSISSREEVVSSVVTLTQSNGLSSPTPFTSSIAPTASSTVKPQVQKTRSVVPSPVSTSESLLNTPVASARAGKYSVVKRPRSRAPVSSSSEAVKEAEPESSPVPVQAEPVSSAVVLPSVVEETLLKTFYTTYTYFSTLFNGQEASTRSRIEVITNVVPTVVRSTIVPEAVTQAASLVAPDQRETTSYTTYTRITTAFKDGKPTQSTRLDTYSNVVIGDSTLRSGVVTPTAVVNEIEPTAVIGRRVSSKASGILVHPEDLNEVASHVSETSETTLAASGEGTTEPANDYYELESSEMTTERSIYNEHEQLLSEDPGDDGEVAATPALKTLFTTFSFFTTYYKGGTSSVATRLQTITNIVSDVVNDGSTTESPESQLPVFPITYLTTFTYWTTHFKDKTAVVTSREETISNIVTPGVDDVVPTATSTVTPSEVPAPSREAKANDVASIEPTEIELTTFFTTYTYFTSSYIGDETVINSRLETITNIVTGTPAETSAVVTPTSASEQAARAIGTSKVAEQEIVESSDFQDYDLPVGLLSTVVNTEVVGSTTVEYSTDVFGTYIDGIYAQVLESTSRVIQPTTLAQTNFMPEATETPTGLLTLNQGKTIEANNAATTFYKTETFGTVIDNNYAHVLQSSSSVVRNPDVSVDPADIAHKTGLVRVIDGSLVKGDKTTFYTSSILGTIIDNQYGQIIESTTRYVISPTKTEEVTTVQPTKAPEVESSEGTTEEIPATTEKEAQVEEEEEDEATKSSSNSTLQSSRRFNGRGRDRASRLSFTATTSKPAPLITPFASRSRPAFVPKRKQSVAVVVTRTDVTPTVTATLAPTTSARPPVSSRGSSFQNRPRFRRPNELTDSVSATTESPVSAATPRLPFTPSRSRFQRPRPTGQADSDSSATIQPSSTVGTTPAGSSPGSRRGFNPRVSSAGVPARRASSTLPIARGTPSSVAGSSSAGSRGSSSSRFAIRPRPSISASRSASATTVKPTQTATLPGEEEYEIVEYEYDAASPGTTTTTTEAPKIPSRFGGNSRFRLNPKLPVPSIALTTTTTPRSTTARDLPFLKRKPFSKPTLPTRATSTTPAVVVDSAEEESSSVDEEEVKQEVAPAPAQNQPTQKPSLKSLIANTKPSSSRPTTRPRTITTTTIPPPRTTTRRSFAPRARPLGFPSRGLVRTPTSTEKGDQPYDGELEPEESKNVPGNLTISNEPAASLEKADAPAAPSGLLFSPLSVQVPAYPQQVSYEESGSVPDLIGSGSEFFGNGIVSPYESYEVFSEESSSKQGGSAEDGSLKRSVRQVDYGTRQRAILRSNIRRPTPGGLSNTNTVVNSRSSPPLNSDYDEYDDTPASPPPPPPPPAPSSRAPSRFRGRAAISPTPSTTPSRQTPFTLTNSNTRSSARTPSPPTNSFTRRSQSRYQRPTEAPSTTTSRSSRFRSRYRQEVTTPKPTTRGRFQTASRGRGSTSSTSYRYDDRNNDYDSRSYVKEIPALPMGSITVTHYIPAETTIPFINGKSTEYKTIITPSPSVETLAPHQYTHFDYQGKEVLVFNNELTSTPSFGVTEITKYLIRESLTTSVTFTPTTIRGRRTSFSHIIPSTVYSVEPVVSTVTNNPLADSNQLTNLLLNQLLGNLNLNPNALLGLQQGLQPQQFQNQQQFGDNQTPVTQFNTKTTTYVTSVTDYTSTVIPITLQGRAIKTTIVESSVNVITATEFITESTVITPAPRPTQVQQQQVAQTQQQQQALGGLNPQLLQNLLQQQQQLILQQQQQQAVIQPTQPAVLVATSSQVREGSKEEPTVQEQQHSVVTLYVSGRNPGEFSTILSTVPVDGNGNRIRRTIGLAVLLEPTKAENYAVVATEQGLETDWDNDAESDDYDQFTFGLDGSYAVSDSYPNTQTLLKNDRQPTQSLDSVRERSSSRNSQSVLVY